MVNDIIKQIIVAAIESFPINEIKKSELLQYIKSPKNAKEVNNGA